MPAAVSRPATALDAAEQSTRERILGLVVEIGPVSVVELARDLDLSPAGVRRHVVALEEAGQITEHRVTVAGPARRGRPARRFVATGRGQAALSSAYADLAGEAMRYLGEVAGPQAIEAFAGRRAAEIRERHPGVARAGTPAERVEALAEALAGDGYAASVRPVPGGRAIQLCQGHCPVLEAAARFPQLCEAETRVFSELLGVHVQRLSTLAAGGHVCTTHVPLTAASPSPAPHTASLGDPTRTTSEPVRAASDRPARGTVEGTR